MIDTAGSLPNRLARWTHRAAFHLAARRVLRRLGQNDTASARVIFDAIDRVMEDAFDPVSREWFKHIEQVRADLAHDESSIAYVDYGVGNRTSRRTDALRPAHGENARTTTRSVAPHSTLQTRTRPEPVRRRVNTLAQSSAPAHEAAVLHSLILSAGSTSCLELGTCMGISAAYMGSAASINTTGRIVSIEGGVAVAERARINLASLGLTNVTVETGVFKTALPAAMEAHGPFDFAFLDGHHDPAATLRYWTTLKPGLSPGALVVVDDISWSSGMRKAWRHLKEDAAVVVAADLLSFGICSVDRT